MRTLRTSQELIAAGLAPAGDLAMLERVGERYAVAVTVALAALMESGADGPLARQFIPSAAELVTTPDERGDPIGDEAHSPVKGIVHRYPDRVLLKVVSVCPVYCRFCFRREMVGPGKSAAMAAPTLDAALAYIAAHPEIWEVILTGGDPFMLSAAKASALTQRLEGIPHVKVIRWHTRMPVADPERIDAAFIAALSASKPVYVAIHANHPHELSPLMRDACARMADAGIVLLGQSVLLHGVNDDIDTLEALMRGLVETRVRPYYLHHPDLAPGTSHFRLTLEEGRSLVRQLRDRVSGICQPDYVIDIPGGVSKALAAASDVEVTGGVSVRGRDDTWREYPPRS
jgi:lysine 2,3-aminomutase